VKIILAHMGGYRLWDDVMKYLVGKDVYFDTAYTVEMKDEVFKGIVDAHGAGKILFGTDFPWERAMNIKEKIEKIINDKEVKDKIYYKNAKKLLNLA
jgi:predicted TIM-barrel fold metal-dependent hydrolase